MAAYNADKQCRQEPTSQEVGSTINRAKIYVTTKSDEIKSFITQMYNNKLYEDYDFLRKHCSSGLLKKLQDAYPYDTDGIAYATWLFRSGQQDSKPGSDDKTIMLEVKADVDWFIYTALDMGWEFTNRIKITNKEGKIIIEDVCVVKE